LFNLADLMWKYGPRLPKNLEFLTSVQLEDGFMVLGGQDNERKAAADVFFIDSRYEWLEIEGGLQEARYLPIGVAVPDEFFNC